MINLELIYKSERKISSDGKPPVYLLCVFRDEELLLEYFISYYKSLGVTHFIMIDNLSIDNGVKYLKQIDDINLLIYRASGSYREAAFGTTWINQLLSKHCNNQYCFTVDVDELFYFDLHKYNSLQDLIASMEESNSNVVATTLLDMYPLSVNNNYKKGQSFLFHSPYFDKFNSTYYRNNSRIYKTFYHKMGGVRERVFNKTVCIHKLPFFKYDFSPIGVAAGYHFFQKEYKDENIVLMDSEFIRLFNQAALLLHFKFIKPDLKNFFQQRVSLNQDWDDSSEYKAYAMAFEEDPSINLYDENYSENFFDSADVVSVFFESLVKE